MPGASDGIISEATVEAAKRRLQLLGRSEMERQLAATESNLKYAISRIAVDSMADMEGVSEEIHTAAYDAVWCAALVAVEAYRIAHYRLWAECALGTALEKLDPDLARRARDETLLRGDLDEGSSGDAATP